MTAPFIAAGLGLRRIGRTWRGACPVHGGSSFTLSEREGTPVWTCWSGCDRTAILSELRTRGLWPERPLWTPEERRTWARRRAAAEGLVQRVQDWQHGKVLALEAAKKCAGDEAALAVAARALYLHESLTGTALVESYRGDLDAARFEAIGRDDREHAELMAAIIVATIATAELRRVA